MNRHRIYLNTEKCVRGLNSKDLSVGGKNISGASLTSAGIYDLLVVVEIAQQNSSVG
jgi:hypothetical protein